MGAYSNRQLLANGRRQEREACEMTPKRVPGCMMKCGREMERDGQVCPHCVLNRWRELDRAIRLQVPSDPDGTDFGRDLLRERVQELVTRKRQLIPMTEKRWQKEFRQLMKENPGVPDDLWKRMVASHRPASSG